MSQCRVPQCFSLKSPDFDDSSLHCTDLQCLSVECPSQCYSVPVSLSSDTSGEPVTGAGDTGREEGGGDTGEEGANKEVAGKRNYGSLTTGAYTRTSLSMFPAKLIQACCTQDQFCLVLYLVT